MKYKIGDVIKVINRGCHYSTYEDWMKAHAPNLYDTWICGKYYNTFGTVKNGMVGTVVTGAEHPKGKDKVLYLIRTQDNELFIISEEGIEKTMCYKIGDRLKIKCGLNYGQLYGGLHFLKEMDIGFITASIVDESDSTVYAKENEKYYSFEMIERKVDMTKNDLKEGMVVELRDGSLKMVKAGMEIENLSAALNNNLTNREIMGKSMDIVAAYEPIWKREESEEISADEALELLKSIPGRNIGKIRI